MCHYIRVHEYNRVRKLMNKPNLNRIKAVLADKKVSAKELAAKLKVHEQTVSSWSTNSKQPSVESIFKIALILKVEAGELLTKVEDLNELA